jgi:hypothetical protein
MKKIFLPLLLLAAVFIPAGCVSSGSEARLRAIEQRQDSILALLQTISAGTSGRLLMPCRC